MREVKTAGHALTQCQRDDFALMIGPYGAHGGLDELSVKRPALVGSTSASWQVMLVRQAMTGMLLPIDDLMGSPNGKGLANAKPLILLVEMRRIELLTFALRSRLN